MKMMKMLKLSCAAVIAMATGADGARRKAVCEDKIDVNDTCFIAQGPP